MPENLDEFGAVLVERLPDGQLMAHHTPARAVFSQQILADSWPADLIRENGSIRLTAVNGTWTWRVVASDDLLVYAELEGQRCERCRNFTTVCGHDLPFKERIKSVQVDRSWMPSR